MLYADTVRLKAHKDILLRERQAARLLCEQLQLARRCALEEDAWRYDQMIRRAEKLARYFQAMYDQVDEMVLKLSRISLEAGMLFEDELHRSVK